jgi:hypothetical protein
MLHKLVNNGENLWSNDPEKRSIIYEKYKQYQVSVSIGFFLQGQILFLILIFRKKKLIGLVYYLMKH